MASYSLGLEVGTFFSPFPSPRREVYCRTYEAHKTCVRHDVLITGFAMKLGQVVRRGAFGYECY